MHVSIVWFGEYICEDVCGHVLENFIRESKAFLHETLMERYLTEDETNEKARADQERREAAVNYATEGERATLLHRASEFGCLPVVRWLLSNSAVVDAKDRSGFTPMLRAAAAGHLRVVMLLLEWNASYRYRSTVTCQSAYDLAKYYGREDVVRFFEVKTYQQRSEELWRHQKENEPLSVHVY